MAALVLLAGCGSGGPANAHGTGTTGGTGSTGGTGVPAALVRQARPIGRGPRFHPPVTGTVVGDCRPGLGRRVGVHVEVFGDDRVVLVAAGVGTRPPRRVDGGRILAARCFGPLATVDPTGVVLIRPDARLTLDDLFAAWGQPLTPRRLASFHGQVRVYVDGRPASVDPRRVRLTPHAEIVLEVGPYVPPHRSYRFPPGG